MKAVDLDLERSFVEREEAFHEAARAAVGYDDFGDPSYREGLHVLLQAWDEEAHFTAQGRFMAQREVLSLRERRLRAVSTGPSTVSLGTLARPYAKSMDSPSP